MSQLWQQRKPRTSKRRDKTPLPEPTLVPAPSPAPAPHPASAPEPAPAASSAAAPAAAVLSNGPEAVSDPVQELRAAAAAKGLTLQLYGGTRTVGDVRPLPPAVAEEMLALVASNMSDFSDWAQGEDRQAEMSNPRTRVLALRATGDKLVGFASYRCMSQETVPVAYLLELQLDVGFRRQGLGSLLLRAVCGLGRAAQRRGLLLTVQLENTAALAFYDACGLEISPISPARCAPAGLEYRHHILQALWDAAAIATMRSRGDATRAFLLEQAAKRAQAQAKAEARAAAKDAPPAPRAPPPTATPENSIFQGTKRPRLN